MNVSTGEVEYTGEADTGSEEVVRDERGYVIPGSDLMRDSS